VLDPIGSIIIFNIYILDLFRGLLQVAEDAVSTVEESQKAVGSLVVSVVDSGKKNVESLAELTAADIWMVVNNSVIGTAIRIEQCGRRGIQTLTGAAFKTGKYIFLIL
jgi:predicted metalloprotease